MDPLIHAAQQARLHAYAPYSGYRVGAALLTDTGQVVMGCNVENISYGATICAERTAVVKMVSDALGTKVAALAVASKDGVPPCGICLQFLSEFVEDGEVLVYQVDESGRVEVRRFTELLPHAFQSDEVARTEI